MKLTDRAKNAWNVFMNKDPTNTYMPYDLGPNYSVRIDRPRFSGGNERSIVTSVFNRIALDASSMTIKHVKTDENGRYKEDVDSGLNTCLSLEANLDQTGRALLYDIYASAMDEGVIAVIPVETSNDPYDTDSYQILSLRTAKILSWYHDHIKVECYDERDGRKKEIIVEKRKVAIIENPFYSVMNEPNSTAKRLMRKLYLLDFVDEQNSSGKLNMIIQLPYVVKSKTRKDQAEERRNDIENQMSNSKLGIAYTDGTEKIIQLNRPLENNLIKQIEYLTNMFYSQLGITQSILDGTADEQTMLNYYSRTIEPIVSAVVDEFKRKFLTKTARTQKQTILSFRDPFKLVPLNNIAEIADKFTRNEIMSSNEIRQAIGMKPSDDPKADQLINSNLNHTPEELNMKPEEDYFEEE